MYYNTSKEQKYLEDYYISIIYYLISDNYL